MSEYAEMQWREPRPIWNCVCQGCQGQQEGLPQIDRQ